MSNDAKLIQELSDALRDCMTYAVLSYARNGAMCVVPAIPVEAGKKWKSLIERAKAKAKGST